MFFKRLVQFVFSRSSKHRSSTPTPKTYSQRLEETSGMTTDQIRSMIAERESEGKPCGVAYREMAERSDRRAAEYHIDPSLPLRSRRKTYSERYSETSALSTSEIRAKIAERRDQGVECGVLYRVLSDRE